MEPREPEGPPTSIHGIVVSDPAVGRQKVFVKGRPEALCIIAAKTQDVPYCRTAEKEPGAAEESLSNAIATK